MTQARSMAWVLLVCLVMPGCWYARMRNPVPVDQQDAARVPGMPLIRAWGDGNDANLDKMIELSLEQEEKWHRSEGRTGPLPPLYSLAISGGGSNGAFGAGFLAGWSQTGTRPEFKVVTGVSTGALIAPFAFLGQKYDKNLAIYAAISDSDIYRTNSLFHLLSADGAADPSPLKKLIEKVITPDLVHEVGVEWWKGRRLLVATSNLDAQRPVVWDMGAIAASGSPDALKVFRLVLLASASVPAAFPPVYIDVDVNGKKYDEMHVDGGTTAQVFFLLVASSPRVAAMLSPNGGEARERHLFVIRNAFGGPQAKEIKAGLVPIATRAIETLVKASGNGDVVRMYAVAHRDGIHFHLTDIPTSFSIVAKTEFDPIYMKGLFELGMATAKNTNAWREQPVNFRLDRPIPSTAPAPATAPAMNQEQ